MIDNDNCTTVAVGKNASASGKVILGHNEDDARSVVQLHLFRTGSTAKARRSPSATVRP